MLTAGDPATPGRGGRGGGRGARTPAAPAIDPRTITDFSPIFSIPFSFSKHPMYPEAHTNMNSIYADAFLAMDTLFTDHIAGGDLPPNFVADPDVVIKSAIRNDSIIPNALDTPGDRATHINPMFIFYFWR